MIFNWGIVAYNVVLVAAAAAAAKSLQSCPTPCDPIDGSHYCTAKQISYAYTYIPSLLDFLPT